jgi:hypothetical protein
VSDQGNKIDNKIRGFFRAESTLHGQISSWQANKLDYTLHVQYEPSSKSAKSQLEAILEDVNDSNQQLIIDRLNNPDDSESLAISQSDIEKLSLLDLGSLDLAGLSLEGISVSKNTPKSEKRRKFLEEEKRRREKGVSSTLDPNPKKEL